MANTTTSMFTLMSTHESNLIVIVMYAFFNIGWPCHYDVWDEGYQLNNQCKTCCNVYKQHIYIDYYMLSRSKNYRDMQCEGCPKICLHTSLRWTIHKIILNGQIENTNTSMFTSMSFHESNLIVWVMYAVFISNDHVKMTYESKGIRSQTAVNHN